MQSSNALNWKPMVPFGAEVEFDLRRPLNDAQVIQLRELYFAHKILLFRRQQLSLSDQRRVMSYVGRVDEETAAVNVLSPDDKALGSAMLHFHSDMTFLPVPPEGLSLHALDVEAGQSCTMFINAVEAYNRLPEDLRTTIQGLKDVSVANYGENCPDLAPYDPPPEMMSCVRDVVMQHPVTGESILYVSGQQTSRIIGFTEADSRRLLDRLLAYVYDEKYVLTHYWVNGDFLIWDNLALQHARPSLKGVKRRKLQRASNSSRPAGEQIAAARGGLPAKVERENAALR